MAFDFDPSSLNIDGVNFSDYELDKNSYNPLVFIHKKCFTKDKRTKISEEILNFRETSDKCQQFDHDKQWTGCFGTEAINNADEIDPVLQQTIRFAKDIIPLTIPATSAEPVYYTIKSKKTSKRKHEACEHSVNSVGNATFDKGKSKIAEIIRCDKFKRNGAKISTDESLSRSSQNNTIDDVNQNKSLSYTLSEVSEQTHFKKECPKKHKYKNHKILPSESFEAIATEYMNISNEANIKIHLMNEKDRILFCENVSSPVVKAVEECFLKLEDRDNEIRSIFSAIQNQATRLDNIFDKLSNIENKLESIANAQNDKTNGTLQEIHCSKLEELGRDIVNVTDCLSSEEELAYVDLKSKNVRTKTSSSFHRTTSGTNMSKVERIDNLARGENFLSNFKAIPSGSELERPNRIPARFCWTDTVKNL